MHLLIKTLCLQWHIAYSDTFTVSRHCHCKQYALYLFINQSLSQPSTTFYEQLFTSSPQNLTHFDFESVFSWPLPPYFFLRWGSSLIGNAHLAIAIGVSEWECVGRVPSASQSRCWAFQYWLQSEQSILPKLRNVACGNEVPHDWCPVNNTC